jgi:tight adherence protein C
MEYVVMLLIFALVFIFTLSGFLMLARGKKRVEDRLQGTSSDPSVGSSTDLLLGDLTPALAGQIPMGDETRTQLQTELVRGGYYRPTALMEYAALRAVLVIIPLVAAGILAFFADSATTGLYIWVGGLLLAGLGYSVPRIYLYYRGKARLHQIERGLPAALDMLTLCLGAGLNVLNSLRRVAEELKTSYPALAYEMGLVSRQAELRTLEFALNQFADRVGLPLVRNIAVIITQSENLGADAVTVLREFSDNLRVNMKQRADEMANKAPFKLLFPAYLLAFGAVILLVSPTILEFSDFFRHNPVGDQIKQAPQQLQNASPSGGNAPTR